jgi:hypothetical protein
VCNGAVTKMIGSKYLQICTEGKLKLKKTEVVAKGYPLVGRDTGTGKGKGDMMFSQTGQNRIYISDCTWYGTVFCDGDVVEVRTIKLHLSMMIIFSLFTGSSQVVVQDEVF